MPRASKPKTASEQAQKVVDTIQDTILNLVLGETADKIVADIIPVIEQRITDRFGFIPEVHEIRTETGNRTIPGIMHEKFDAILKIVAADIPVYLFGSAGSGKSYVLKQIADALGLEFYFTNAITQEFNLKGFIDANGTYHETQFYQAFTKGGLFFLDEIDASIPEALVILNAAIANKYFDFPIGRVNAHPNFRVVAAGNTVGTGADNNYTGRYCLDKASLDRFAIVEFDYDSNIESSLCNHNQELLEFCREFRKCVKEAGIECLCSYRTIERISKLENVLNLEDVIKISLIKGLEIDDIEIIKNKLKHLSNNKYYKALCGEVTPKTKNITAEVATTEESSKYEDIIPF